MAYNHGREERKWRLWKEAEESLAQYLEMREWLRNRCGSICRNAAGGYIELLEFPKDVVYNDSN